MGNSISDSPRYRLRRRAEAAEGIDCNSLLEHHHEPTYGRSRCPTCRRSQKMQNKNYSGESSAFTSLNLHFRPDFASFLDGNLEGHHPMMHDGVPAAKGVAMRDGQATGGASRVKAAPGDPAVASRISRSPNTGGEHNPSGPSRFNVLVEVARLVLTARARIGITGTAGVVGLLLCVDMREKGISPSDLALKLVAIATFSLLIVACQWVERKLNS
jgi:hypothetical protein